MKIQKCKNINNYTADFECMGKGLVLIKVSASSNCPCFKYHYFFEDKKKPPLDIAVNPKSGIIEYISIFLQDEKIEFVEEQFNLTVFEESVQFINELVTDKKPHLYSQTQFTFKLIKNNLFITSIDIDRDILAYSLAKNIYILFSAKNIFSGVLIKNISVEVLELLKTADVI